MKDLNIVIAGKGIVGNSISKRFFPEADFFDPYKGYYHTEKKYDCCIICVPTPLVNGGLSTNHVEEVLNTINADYFIVKSTVPIGFCDKHHNVMFSPEFSGSTAHNVDIDDNFTIIGATTNTQRQFVSDLFYSKKPSHLHKIYFTTNKEAELLKLMENAYLGYIVTFATEINKIATKYDIDYNVVSELLKLDPRMPQSHTHVFDGQDYYSSHCLNKDIPELARDSKLLTYIINYNYEKMMQHV
ncbi:hypothetical protein ACTNDN_06765 [Niallia sp. HCP3S3_B10]|uniref:hypothetical protein n=1 Tax=Niallia sp. HCP3S3_B10 TaxID=3438944 RepID=UPI003F8B0537